jgi:hypothetical protein
MTVPDLLMELYQRGILLTREGENLRYRAKTGRLTSELKEAIAEHKNALLKLLAAPLEDPGSDPDLAWRIAAMRAQIPQTGPIRFLSARPDALVACDAEGKCPSCGDPLPAIRTQRFRCTACTRAAWLALDMGDPLAMLKESCPPLLTRPS